MKYYPVFLNVRDRDCLVVGGGRVGARKAATLCRCGARVTVVSPDVSESLLRDPGIRCRDKGYEATDLDGMFLVFAATDSAALNRQVQSDAVDRNILCNSADTPDQGDFILPAVVEQGDLVCAVSTSGASPALARKIRQDLAGHFGPEYATFLTLMKAVRKKLLAAGHDPDGHKKIFNALIDQDLPALIANQDFDGIDSVLTRILGPDALYRDLISQES